MPHVENDGVRIEYEVVGQSEPLALIHGWSCEGRYWREFGYLDRLTDEFMYAEDTSMLRGLPPHALVSDWEA